MFPVKYAIVLIATLFLAPLAAMRAADITPAKPNILYIFTDDHSARTLGCYLDTPDAYPWVKTPHIDKLATEGVRFTTCYTGAKCVPSRGSALTGKLQGGYTKESPYWQSKLRQQGYYTGMIGKWHWNVPRHGDAWDWSVVWPHHEGNSSDDGDGSDYYIGQRVSINGGELEFGQSNARSQPSGGSRRNPGAKRRPHRLVGWIKGEPMLKSPVQK